MELSREVTGSYDGVETGVGGPSMAAKEVGERHGAFRFGLEVDQLEVRAGTADQPLGGDRAGWEESSEFPVPSSQLRGAGADEGEAVEFPSVAVEQLHAAG